MRRLLSWLLRSKVLSNKEYQDLIETGENLRKDVAFWKKAYGDGHELLSQALASDVTSRTSRLDEAQKKLDSALEELRAEYDSLYQIWTSTRAVEESLRKATAELESRVGQQSH